MQYISKIFYKYKSKVYIILTLYKIIKFFIIFINQTYLTRIIIIKY